MARARLLIADDEPSLREILVEALRQEGFEVVEAADGDEAIQLFAVAGPFDALVLDEEMPGLRGREVLFRLRSAGASVAAVLCSGSLEMDAEERARLAVDAFLRKPFPLEALFEAVRRALTRAR